MFLATDSESWLPRHRFSYALRGPLPWRSASRARSTVSSGSGTVGFGTRCGPIVLGCVGPGSLDHREELLRCVACIQPVSSEVAATKRHSGHPRGSEAGIH